MAYFRYNAEANVPLSFFPFHSRIRFAEDGRNTTQYANGAGAAWQRHAGAARIGSGAAGAAASSCAEAYAECAAQSREVEAALLIGGGGKTP